MIILRDPNQLPVSPEQQATNNPTNAAFILAVLNNRLQYHFQALSAPETYDPEEHGYIVIAEPGDAVKTLKAETGCPILTDWFKESRYGDDGFAPAFDWLDEQPFCYEMGFTLNDSGFTVLLIIPKLSGIDTELLAMCCENACEKTG
jgi:hypothetical protein